MVNCGSDPLICRGPKVAVDVLCFFGGKRSEGGGQVAEQNTTRGRTLFQHRASDFRLLPNPNENEPQRKQRKLLWPNR
jgi:hypothetical protein